MSLGLEKCTAVVQEYLQGLAPWNGKGDFTLDRIKAILTRLNSPQDQVQAVHIAGSNGKGSCAAMLASCLGAAGKRVGLTTSPHLVSVLERIVVDGAPLSPKKFDFAVNLVRDAAEGAGVTPTFFEAIIASAFVTFAEERVDYAVIETGLGGRLDATNVISRPLATAISSVGLEHTAILGDSIAQIAKEKAGISRSGIPMCLGKVSVEASNSVRGSVSRWTSVREFGKDFGLVEGSIQSSDGGPSGLFWGRGHEMVELSPNLRGTFQLHNAALAAALGEELGLQNKQINQGVRGVFWPARLEEISAQGCRFLIDAAHNPDGISAFRSFVVGSEWEGAPIVFGALNTKPWRQMVDLVKDVAGEWLLIEPRSEAAVPASEIQEYLSSIGIRAQCLSDTVALLNLIISRGFHQIIAVGSIYLIGGLRQELSKSVPGLSEKALWMKT